MLCSLQNSGWWTESTSLVIPSSKKGSGSIIVDWLHILTINYHEVYEYGIGHDFYSAISVNLYQISVCDNCAVRILCDWGFMSSWVWHCHWVSGFRYFEKSHCLLIQSHAVQEEWLLDLENEGTKILLKFLKSLSKQYSVTFWRTWILKNTTLRASNPTVFHKYCRVTSLDL